MPQGAYYYYQTEPGRSFEETFYDVSDYLDRERIPARRYIQFDSWWYYKGARGGCALWVPRPEVMESGFAVVHRRLNASLALHNRWWAADTLYDTRRFPFWTDPQTGFALPLTRDFWDALMRNASDWGVVVYEQDWLVDQYRNLPVLQNNVHVARQWMQNMSDAAVAHGIHIQYCMPLPMDYLESTLHPPVTHIRASDDYQPGKTAQWAIGSTSMLAWALGLLPFKDVFWTTSVEPGNRYNSSEPTPELETIAALLSTGPVAIGDAIGYVNRTLIMRTCAQNGLLLRPDKPATNVDAWYTPSQYQPGSQVAATFSTLWTDAGPVRVRYIFAANLSRPFVLQAHQLGMAPGEHASVHAFGASADRAADFVLLDATHPLIIDVGVGAYPAVHYRLYVAVPQLSGGWRFFGEHTVKYVSASRQRFGGRSVAVHSDAAHLIVPLWLAAGETTELLVLAPNGLPLRTHCTAPADREAEMLFVCDGARVRCQCAIF